MSASFKPGLETLEDRLTPTVASPMTNYAQTLAYDAYQNIVKLESVYNNALATYQAFQNHQGMPSMQQFQTDLAAARAIVANEHSLANGMYLGELYELYYRSYYRNHGVSLSETQFLTADYDFHVYDNYINSVAVPEINRMEAWLDSVL